MVFWGQCISWTKSLEPIGLGPVQVIYSCSNFIGNFGYICENTRGRDIVSSGITIWSNRYVVEVIHTLGPTLTDWDQSKSKWSKFYSYHLFVLGRTLHISFERSFDSLRSGHKFQRFWFSISHFSFLNFLSVIFALHIFKAPLTHFLIQYSICKLLLIKHV